MAAGDTILAKIKEDPQSGCCPNLSYAGFAGPVANANPTGMTRDNTYTHTPDPVLIDLRPSRKNDFSGLNIFISHSA